MDRNTSILKSIKEDFSYQIAKAIMRPFDRNNIKLNSIRLTVKDNLRSNKTTISVSYNSSSTIQTLEGNVDGLIHVLEVALQISNLEIIQYNHDDKYFFCVFEDIVFRFEKDTVYLMSLDRFRERLIHTDKLSDALILLESLFNPGINEYRDARAQFFLDRGYLP